MLQYTVAAVGASSDAADVVGANGSFTATTAAVADWPTCVHCSRLSLYCRRRVPQMSNQRTIV